MQVLLRNAECLADLPPEGRDPNTRHRVQARLLERERKVDMKVLQQQRDEAEQQKWEAEESVAMEIKNTALG